MYKEHGIHENITWLAKYHKRRFLEYKEHWLELIFGGTYKMLVDYISDNKGRSLLYHECYVILVIVNTLDNNENCITCVI